MDNRKKQHTKHLSIPSIATTPRTSFLQPSSPKHNPQSSARIFTINKTISLRSSPEKNTALSKNPYTPRTFLTNKPAVILKTKTTSKKYRKTINPTTPKAKSKVVKYTTPEGPKHKVNAFLQKLRLKVDSDREPVSPAEVSLCRRLAAQDSDSRNSHTKKRQISEFYYPEGLKGDISSILSNEQ